MPEPTIRLDGAFELRRAFSKLSRDFAGGIREAMENAAEPVRSDASNLTRQNVSGMQRSKLPWWRMRVGVTQRTVYIAPEQRGVKSGRISDRRRRPKLRTHSEMRPSMDQAMDRNRGGIVEAVQDEMTELFRVWGRF